MNNNDETTKTGTYEFLTMLSMAIARFNWILLSKSPYTCSPKIFCLWNFFKFICYYSNKNKQLVLGSNSASLLDGPELRGQTGFSSRSTNLLRKFRPKEILILFLLRISTPHCIKPLALHQEN